MSFQVGKGKQDYPSSALLHLLGEGSPAKMDYRRNGPLILTSPLEDLEEEHHHFADPIPI